MNNFLISLSHPCMYGRGNIRVLEGVVELENKVTSCLGLQAEWLVFLCGTSLWLMQVVVGD